MIIPVPKFTSNTHRWCNEASLRFSREAELVNSDPSSKAYALWLSGAAFHLAKEIDNRFDMESKKDCIDLLLWMASELELYKAATIRTALFAMKMKHLEKAFEF